MDDGLSVMYDWDWLMLAKKTCDINVRGERKDT